MFTGIVEAQGRVLGKLESGLVIEAVGTPWDDPVVVGESIAVNGCCLTVASLAEGLRFDLSQETWRRTALGGLHEGSTVNLERALRASARLGGHMVQGHIDAVGELVSRTPDSLSSETFRFRIPNDGARYLIDKGSIAIDGISLTVVEPAGNEFKAAVVPHTLAATNLGEMQPGAKVNVEYDVLAKHVEKLLGSR